MLDKPLILASQSRSRAQLLKAAGFVSLRQMPSDLDEAEVKKKFQGSTEALALALAQQKARIISERYLDDWVVAADQILVFEGSAFDKSNSIQEAKALFRNMRGKTHQLLGGHALMRGGQLCWQHLSKVEITLRDFSDQLLNHYLEIMGDQTLACVGGYQLEGIAIHLFDKIKGDYFSVLGLDMLPLLAALRAHGVVPT